MVLDDDLDHGPAAAGAPEGGTANRGGDHRLLVLDEGGDLGLPAPVDEATRIVHEQVEHGLDPHRLEARGFARLDRPQFSYALVREKPQSAAARRLAHSTEIR